MLHGVLNSIYAFKRQQDETPTTFCPCILSSVRDKIKQLLGLLLISHRNISGRKSDYSAK